MDEATLIQTLQSHLSGAFSEPVRTSGTEDEYPVPSIVLEDWTTEELSFHNSPFANEAVGDFDGDGSSEYERYLNFDWRTRLEYVVTDDDDVAATRLKDSLVNSLRPFTDDAARLHADLKNARIRSHGSPSYQFTEPKETELNVSVVFRGDHTLVLTPADLDSDPLEAVEETFTITD
jgi:hypothetical protein